MFLWSRFFNIADSLCERMDVKEFDPYGRLEICWVRSSWSMLQIYQASVGIERSY
jgi:hypothetical protein